MVVMRTVDWKYDSVARTTEPLNIYEVTLMKQITE
jgi:hypothetical protein